MIERSERSKTRGQYLNTIRRHGAVDEITDYRDHDNEIYIDIRFDQPAMPAGFTDEYGVEIVSTWVERRTSLLGLRSRVVQAACVRAPLLVEE